MKQLYLGDLKINEGLIIDNLKQINFSDIRLNKSLGLDYTLDVVLTIQPAVRQVLLVDNELFIVEKVKNNYDGTYDVEALPLHYILRDIMFKDLTTEKFTYVYFYGNLQKLLEMITININWYFYQSTRSSYNISGMPIQVNDIFEIDSSVDTTININKSFVNNTLMEVLETLTNELQLKFIPQKTSLNIQSGIAIKPQFLFKIVDIVNYSPPEIINIDEVNIENIEENNIITSNKLYVNGGQDGLQPIDYVYPSSNIMTPNYDAVIIGDTSNGEIEGKIQTNINPKALYGYVIGHDTTNNLLKIEGNVIGAIPLFVDGSHTLTKTDVRLISGGIDEEHEVFDYVKHFSNVSGNIELTSINVQPNETNRLSVIYFAFKTNKFISNLSVGVVDTSNIADAIEYYNIPANTWVYIAVPYKVTYNKLVIGGIPEGANIYIADITHAYSSVVYDSDLNAYSGWFNIKENTFEYQIIQLTTSSNVWQFTDANYHTCDFEEDTDLANELGVTTANKFISHIAIAPDTTFTYDSNEQYAIVLWNNPVTYLMIKQAEGILTTFVEKLKPFIGQSIKTISLTLPAIEEYENVDIGIGLNIDDNIYIVRKLSYNPISKTTIQISEATTSFTDLNEIIKHAETIKGIGYFTINEISKREDSSAVIGKPNTTITPVPPPTIGDSVPPATPTIIEWSGLFQTIKIKCSHNTEPDFSHYIIQYDTDPNFTNPSEIISKSNYIAIKSLDLDTTYHIRLRAVDMSGNKSEWSNRVSATTAKISDPESFVAGVIKADAIDVDYLSAISANIGEITAGKLKGQYNSTTVDLDNDLIDIGNGAVRIGRIDNQTIQSATVNHYIGGSSGNPDVKIYASIDNINWYLLTFDSNGDANVSIFEGVLYGKILYIKISAEGTDGSQGGALHLYIDNEEIWSVSYSIVVGDPDEIYTIQTPKLNDGIEINNINNSKLLISPQGIRQVYLYQYSAKLDDFQIHNTTIYIPPNSDGTKSIARLDIIFYVTVADEGNDHLDLYFNNTLKQSYYYNGKYRYVIENVQDGDLVGFKATGGICYVTASIFVDFLFY